MSEDPTKGDDEKESLARAHLPYRAEYCKTGRAKCKKCSESMEGGSLKLANMVKSRFHDGYDANFYHVKCFFSIKRPTTIAEIRHFETLKYEDQKMLEKAVETNGMSVVGTEVNGDSAKPDDKKKSKSKKRESGTSLYVNYDDYLVEYAKSGRAKCNLCEEKIDKESIRLGKLDYAAETHWNGGPVPRWFHIECFIKSMEQLEFYGKVEKIKNFSDLEEEDQVMLKKKIKPPKPNIAGTAEKRPKIEISKDQEAEEKILKKQSDKFFALREHVASMKKKDIENLLSRMGQKSSFRSPQVLIDMATDVLLFGPFKKCPSCKNKGSMELRGSCYICTSGTDWQQCSYETRTPRRDVPDIDPDLLEKYEFFNSGEYKFIGGGRIFPSTLIKAVEQKEAEDNNIVEEGAPLEGLSIGVISWKGIKNDKTKVQKKITTLGGKVQTALDRTLFIILSSAEELAKDSPKVEVAKALGVPFATADFLFQVKSKDDVVPRLQECLLDEWSGDLAARFAKMNVKQLKSNIKNRSEATISKKLYKSGSVAKSQTLVVKDGTAVDPDSGYAQVGRVYKAGPHVYSVILNCVDVSKDKNSFYKIQVIEHETKKRYMLFRSWGRIGCDIGGSTCKETKDLQEALSMFEDLFQERTGNEFSTIAAGTFERRHGLYFPVEVDYSEPVKKEPDEQALQYSSQSNLDRAVQELISFIFDIKRMDLAMKHFELDAEKMPLGKLSKKHIHEAMETLKQLEEVLEVKPPAKPKRSKLIALTNKFYSHIPQSFGDGQVKLIDSLEQVSEKNQMLTGLLEIEIAYTMSTTIDKTSETLPVDQHYLQLNCRMTALDKDGDEYKLIIDYAEKTHAITHGNYSLKIQEIIKVDRDNDLKRFSEHSNKDRALLWHGSRTTNYAGILNQGLRIAPPEAPSTGYMFGKGIYFADMSSKAANYCITDPSNNIGLLLLCEVAVGKMHEVFESDSNFPEGLPSDCDSVKGVGKAMTNPKTHVKIEDDILVPVGRQTPNKGIKSQLLYNEYVVYNESQAKMRYIVRAEFIFK